MFGNNGIPNFVDLPDNFYNTPVNRGMLQNISEMNPVSGDIILGLDAWEQEVMQHYNIDNWEQAPYIKNEVEIVKQAYLDCAKGALNLTIGSDVQALNYITSLPDILDKADFLIDHICINNLPALPSLPDSLGQLKGVMLFEVCNCGLTEISNFLEDFQKNNENTLEHFDISENQLEGEVPPLVFEFKNIEILQFSNNHFDKLPENFANIRRSNGTANKTLYIDGNEFEKLPDELLILDGWGIECMHNPATDPNDECYNEEMLLAIRDHNLIARR